MIINFIARQTLAQSALKAAIRSSFIGSNSFKQYRHYSDSAAYGGDGKTTVRLLDEDEPHLNLILSYSAHGFRLSNKVFIKGSILTFPTNVFSWAVRRGEDITPESLIVFDLIVPKAKIVVIGYGQHGEPYDERLPLILKQKGISCELLPTPQAVSTYNYLVCDSVHVAGAFVPVKEEVKMLKIDEAYITQQETISSKPKERQFNPNAGVPRVDLRRVRAELVRQKEEAKTKKTFDD